MTRRAVLATFGGGATGLLLRMFGPGLVGWGFAVFLAVLYGAVFFLLLDSENWP